jgi:hypothetical protein
VFAVQAAAFSDVCKATERTTGQKEAKASSRKELEGKLKVGDRSARLGKSGSPSSAKNTTV